VQQKRKAILLTRPQRQAERFAASCRARFGPETEIVISPLIKIGFIRDNKPFEKTDLAIFTSENGVEAFVRNRPGRGVSAWCVGSRTARAARDCGMEAKVASGTADALADEIIAARPAERLIHFRGEHASTDLASRLAAAGLQAQDRIVYRQSARSMSSRAKKLMEGETTVVLPLFSSRSARLFLAESGCKKQDLQPVAISKAVAHVLESAGFENITIALRPDASALLDAMARLMDA